jgi:hypothetical protein
MASAFQSNNEVKQYLDQIFGKDIETYDATFPLRVQPTEADMVGADPKDPFNCFFVRAIKRMYGSYAVVFWKTIAYVDLINGQGVRCIYRFSVPKDATVRLGRFDRGEDFPKGAAITLLPPTKAETLQQKRRSASVRSKRYIDRRKQLKFNIVKANKALEKANQRMQQAMANETQDKVKLSGIARKQQTAEAIIRKNQSLLDKMDSAKTNRAPKHFDLTTRNGAIGNYHLTDSAA